MTDTGSGIALLDHFSALKDPRQAWKVVYPLPEILLLLLAATLAGADDFVEVRLWGRQHLAFLRRFLPFHRGIPSHDTLGDVLNALDPELFKRCFAAWVEALRDAEPEIVAIDGKTSRRCHAKAKGRDPLHLVSAWASRQRLVLGQEAVAGKSNEITAIPLLLERLELAGALVTIDRSAIDPVAQRAAPPRRGRRRHRLPDQDRQGDLGQASRLPAGREDQLARAPCRDRTLLRRRTGRGGRAAGDHRRRPRPDRGPPPCRQPRHRLAGRRPPPPRRAALPRPRGGRMVEAEVERNGQTSIARRYYLCSAGLDAASFARAVRAHWGIENRLHWILDVVFHDDLTRLRTGHGPANMATVRHMAMNLVRQAEPTTSLKNRRKKAAWSTDYLETLLRQTA
jgi:predicted transposase YbfD/YdcC